MDKRIEGSDRLGEGGPQDGDIGTASDAHQNRQDADRSREELRGDLGVGGQRHEGGSSRDPEAQGRRTVEEKRG